MADISLIQDVCMDDCDEGVYEQGDCSTGSPSDDDVLPPLTRIQKYAASGNIYDRQMVARILQELFRTAPADVLTEELPSIMEIVQRIGEKDESMVRTDLLEQIPHIAKQAIKYSSRVEILDTIIGEYLIPLVVRNLGISDNTVDKAAHTTLLNLLEQHLITKTQVEIQVCPAILALTYEEQAADINTAPITLMCKLASLLGQDIVERVFLKRFCELCHSTMFYVRKICASHICDMCVVVGKEQFEKLLLPCYISLCQDGIWGVRKSCAEVAMFISLVCSQEVRRGTLTSIFSKLLQDDCRWVQMAAFQTLGPFISTFADPPITYASYNSQGDLVFVNIEGDEFMVNSSGVPDVRFCKYLPKQQSQQVSHLSSTSNDYLWELWGVEPEDVKLKHECDILGEEYDCNDEQLQQQSMQQDPFNVLIDYGEDDESMSENKTGNNSNVKPATNDDNVNEEEDGLTTTTQQQSTDDQMKEIVEIAIKNAVLNCTEQEFGIGDNNNLNKPITNNLSNEENVISNNNINNKNETCDNLDSDKDMMKLNEDEFKAMSSLKQEKIVVDDVDNNSGVNDGNNLSTPEIMFESDSIEVDHEEVILMNDIAEDIELVNNNDELINNEKDDETRENVVVGDENNDKSINQVNRKTSGGDNEIETKEDDDLHLFNSYNYWYISPDIPLDLNLVVNNNGQQSPNNSGTLVVDNVIVARLEDMLSNINLNQTFTIDTQCDSSSDLDSSTEVTELVPVEMEQDIVPQVLINHYILMTDSRFPLNVDTEMSYHCAYSLPAVAKTLDKKNWPLLKRTIERLASDMQYKVRRVVASSLHELATILGRDIATEHLTPIFEGFIKDLDEVRIGILKHLACFLKIIKPAKRLTYLPLLQEFLTTENNWNWRFRHELAKQLFIIVRLFRPIDSLKHVGFVAEVLLHDVSAVRQVAIWIITELLRHISSTPGLNNHFLVKLVQRYAHSKRWVRRQSFALLCDKILSCKALPPEQFASDIMPHLLDLSWDPVANVRLVVAKTIAQHIIANEYFSDPSNEYFDSLGTVLRRLQADKDRDVRYYAEVCDRKERETSPVMDSTST